MMSNSLRLFLSIALVIYFLMILTFLKKKSLSLKYTLLWIFSGCCMIVLIINPLLLDWMTSIVDIKSTVNGLFAVVIFFLMIILMSLTSIVSKQSEKIKNLVQESAILEKRIRDIEDNNLRGKTNE